MGQAAILKHALETTLGDPRTTLLDALREHLHLTGSKKGCGLDQCGGCTVRGAFQNSRQT